MSGETRERVFLECVSRKTGERYGRVEVTGRSEREIERIEIGMLTNLHPNWYVDLVTVPTLTTGGTHD